MSGILRPSYIVKNSPGSSFSGGFTIVHERPEESIQGGAPGEHYHLTAAEYTTLGAGVASGKIYEPLMAAGELVLNPEEDIMMAWGGSYAS